MPLPVDSLANTIKVVAQTAWGEARNQGEVGMQAVINVIMNRVALRTWYGLNPVAVCRKASQFDCWMPGDVNLPKLQAVNDNDPQFVIALKLARLAVAGDLPDITGGAVQYYAAGTPEPGWAKTMVPTHQIGAHLFFKRKAA